MTLRPLVFSPEASTDLLEAWQLVYYADGRERADALLARIETFCRSLAHFAEVGTALDTRRPGLRRVGIPRLRTASVVFRIERTRVVIVRIGYLGRNI